MEPLPTCSNAHGTRFFNFEGLGYEVLLPVFFSLLLLIPSLNVPAWSLRGGGYMSEQDETRSQTGGQEGPSGGMHRKWVGSLPH
jgi:hypothetical protein